MPISLRFNGQKFQDDLRAELNKTMKSLIDEFYKAATAGMSAEAKAASKNQGIIEDIENHVVARCAFYTDAILESYGIGSKADTSYWDEYKESGLLNPVRNGKAIVGRPEGEYTNIWGEPDYSSGTKEGQLLESKSGKPRKFFDAKKNKWVTIEPKYGTYAIQKEEAWLMQNRETSIERRVKETVLRFIEHVNQNPLEYFYYV